MKTTAIFFPFALFGSPGTSTGTELLADAFREMLADNQRERTPTRARAYQNQVRLREIAFETLSAYQDWRSQARRLIRPVFRKKEMLLWVSGNHLGVLPVYDELAGSDSLVIQLDAHLDIFNLTDCISELSHGNFLLHCSGQLPRIINVGTRDLLLRPEYIRQYYQATYSAADLASAPELILEQLRKASQSAEHVWLDLDCDVFDPAYFPAVSQPLPFGLSPPVVLRILDAVWSDRVQGVAISEFDPGRDRNDQSLAILVWLLEYLLLKWYERADKK